MLKLEKKIDEVDVLVVGGGIAGLMAAIRAAMRARVWSFEKANTQRSGSSATGNDHFGCYLPEYHGDNMEPILWEDHNSHAAGFTDTSLAGSFSTTAMLGSGIGRHWGIP